MNHEVISFTQVNSVHFEEEGDGSFYTYLHKHKDIQISLILKGHGILTLEDHVESFKPGDLYIIGPNQNHRFTPAQNDSSLINEEPEALQGIHIYFDLDKTVVGLWDIYDFKRIRLFLEKAKMGLRMASGSFVDKLKEHFEQIKFNTGIKRLLALISLLDLLSRNDQNWNIISEHQNKISIPESSSIRMNKVYNYTYQNYQDNITLEQIASIACLSPNAFCKYFKRYASKTYLTFLNEVRVYKACELLAKHEQYNVTSVAYQTGFNNLITFNRVFKKLIGKTPSEYVKYLRRDICLL